MNDSHVNCVLYMHSITYFKVIDFYYYVDCFKYILILIEFLYPYSYRVVLAANAFTKKNLDDICENLNPSVWCNPHRSMLGFGNYDINVIMQALEMRDCEATWFDKRRQIYPIHFSL